MDGSLDREPESIGSDLTDAQLAKLESISPVWGRTFAAHPGIDRAGYANLRRVEKLYGKARVRDVFDYAYEKRIVPKTETAMGLVISLCKAQGGRHA